VREGGRVGAVSEGGLRGEVLLKTDGGYPRDAGVFFIHDGNPFVFFLSWWRRPNHWTENRAPI